jgi:hypothetical protein
MGLFNSMRMGPYMGVTRPTEGHFLSSRMGPVNQQFVLPHAPSQSAPQGLPTGEDPRATPDPRGGGILDTIPGLPGNGPATPPTAAGGVPAGAAPSNGIMGAIMNAFNGGAGGGMDISKLMSMLAMGG